MKGFHKLSAESDKPWIRKRYRASSCRCSVNSKRQCSDKLSWT